tara:strand:+ start:177 stop:557 length:381 start_codon:yes stop_codon:yes gene_type:complete
MQVALASLSTASLRFQGAAFLDLGLPQPLLPETTVNLLLLLPLLRGQGLLLLLLGLLQPLLPEIGTTVSLHLLLHLHLHLHLHQLPMTPTRMPTFTTIMATSKSILDQTMVAAAVSLTKKPLCRSL